MNTDLRYAMVVVETPSGNKLERRVFRELKTGDVFRLHNPSGDVVNEEQPFWKACEDPKPGDNGVYGVVCDPVDEPEILC